MRLFEIETEKEGLSLLVIFDKIPRKKIILWPIEHLSCSFNLLANRIAN